jgi:glycosyltransferase involved in cell wall biosynthesis
MILIVHTSTASDDIPQRLGRPEYSYRFVLREFKPLLEQLGTVIEVADPELEVDLIYAACMERGEPCMFLCFLPPNKTPIGLSCPTIPVFAWEFETIPNEAFAGKPRNDWRRVLTRLGGAITHSSYTVARTHAELGEQFAITCIPAPLWDRMQPLRNAPPPSQTLPIDGWLIDSARTDLSAYRKSELLTAAPGILPMPPNMDEYQGSIDLQGVIYTTIFNPYDARKNWLQMINAFCEALRDKPDATLLIKLTHYDPVDMIPDMLEAIYTMGPASCRVLLVHAYLQEADYNALLRNTTYTVNVSNGEGQCLPLMEYMSAGIPALACRHTSMRDYIDSECAFVVDSSLEMGTWPHDQRQAYRTMRQRVHYQSLVNAYRRSYHVARQEPDVYARMGAAASQSLERFCSTRVLRPRLERFLAERIAQPSGMHCRPESKTAGTP